MTNRVALGLLRNGAYGMEISKPGVNVLDAAALDRDMIFSTKWGHSGSVHTSGTIVYAGSPITVYFTALEYVPFAMVYFATNSSGSIGRRVYSTAVAGPVGAIYTHRNTPIFTVYNDRIVISAESNISIRYLILRVPGV